MVLNKIKWHKMKYHVTIISIWDILIIAARDANWRKKVKETLEIKKTKSDGSIKLLHQLKETLTFSHYYNLDTMTISDMNNYNNVKLSRIC